MYQIFTTEELRVAARVLCQALARRFDIGSADARALLHHCQWDLARTEALLSDADRRETVAKEAGMELYCPERPPFPGGGTECAICYDDVEEESQGHALECGHWFCLDCWQGHCHASIGSGMAVIRCTCPDEDCSRLVDDDTLARFSDERDKHLLRTIVAKSVGTGTLAQQCPRTACERHAMFANPAVLNVFCDCSECFCFRCGQRGHGPCPCELAVVFESKEAWSKDPENGRLDKSLVGKIKPW
jgi:ariadne-1